MADTTSSTLGDDFSEVVASEFSFLGDRGFRCTVESEDSVLYEAANGAFVRVFRDSRDKYVGFRAGMKSRPKDALTVPELARLTGADIDGEFPESVSELRAGTARLARLLKDFGERVLSGDETILDEAMALRSEYTKSFTRPQPPDEKRSAER